MKARGNIIQRQILQVNLPAREQAFEIQNRISVLYQTRIVGVLDEVCTRVASPGEHLQIEELEIDLGSVCLSRLEEEFTEKISGLFYEELSGRAHEIRRTQRIQGIRAKGLGVRCVEERAVSGKVFKLELFGHFLRMGLLPWWAQREWAARLEEVLSDLLKEAPEELRILIEGELRHKDARHRLIHQFSDRLIANVVELLSSEKECSVRSWVRDLAEVHRQAQITHVSATDFRLLVWDTALTEMKPGRPKRFGENQFLDRVLEAIFRQYEGSYQAVVLSMQRAAKRLSASRAKLESSLPQLIVDRTSELQQQAGSPGVSGHAQPVKRSPEQKSDRPDAFENRSDEFLPIEQPHRPGEFEILSARSRPADRKTPGDSIEEGVEFVSEDLRPETVARAGQIYVENAGLVILWPHLSHFFGLVDLMENDKFIDETATVRAVHLLQYLATGEQETAECFLSLNKLLCGWAISGAVSKRIVLAESEKAESEQLLSTVISEWSALKNTSIGEFQKSFLQRAGVLAEERNRWLLKVERKPFDLLLERLPWGLSMIKLSWMKTLLCVEW
jgi:hypothetical protein